MNDPGTILKRLNCHQRGGIWYSELNAPLGASPHHALAAMKRRLSPVEWLRNFPELQTRQRRHACTLSLP